MSQLMARSRVLHLSFSLYFICLFIYNKSIIRVDASDIIIFLFSTDNKDLVLSLDRCKLSWKFVSISYLDTLSCLTGQFMDIEFLALLIIIMKSWPYWGKNVVRFETDYIMKESSKFINFTFNLNVWS